MSTDNNEEVSIFLAELPHPNLSVSPIIEDLAALDLLVESLRSGVLAGAKFAIVPLVRTDERLDDTLWGEYIDDTVNALDNQGDEFYERAIEDGRIVGYQLAPR
jgi:hypothetical protein